MHARQTSSEKKFAAEGGKGKKAYQCGKTSAGQWSDLIPAPQSVMTTSPLGLKAFL